MKSSPQSLLGVLIIGLGLGFLLDALNIWDFSTILARWWPLLIVAGGVLSLISNPKLIVWPVVVMAIGLLLLLKQLDLVNFNIWGLIWPTILIFLGLSFLSDKFGPRPHERTNDHVDLFVAFSGIDNVNKASNFQGGKITALFGGVNLDLRQARVQREAKLDVFMAFGGVEIKVPEGWIVKASGLPLFGGWEDKTTKPSNAGAPVLHVRGTCLFGGFEIKNS